MGAGATGQPDIVYEVGGEVFKGILRDKLLKLGAFSVPIYPVGRSGTLKPGPGGLRYVDLVRGDQSTVRVFLDIDWLLNGLGVTTTSNAFILHVGALPPNTLAQVAARYGFPEERLGQANQQLAKTYGLNGLLPVNTQVSVPQVSVPVSDLLSEPAGTSVRTEIALKLQMGARSQNESRVPFTIEINQVQGGIAVTLPGTELDTALRRVRLVPNNDVQAVVRNHIKDAIVAALRSQIPPTDWPGYLPILQPTETCDIVPRQIDLGMLQGGALALSFWIQEDPNQEGANLGTIRATHLISNPVPNVPSSNVALSLGPSLLKRLICCTAGQTIYWLQGRSHQSSPTSCQWNNVGSIFLPNGERVNLHSFSIAVGNGLVAFTAVVSKSTWFYSIKATVVINASLRLENGVITSTNISPDVQIDDWEIPWWVWLIIALIAAVFLIVGYLCGWVPWMIAGSALLGLATVGLAVNMLVAWLREDAIRSGLHQLPVGFKPPLMLPPSVVALFGTVNTQELTFDDLVLSGPPVFPPGNGAVFLAQSAPQSVQPGEVFGVSIRILNAGTRTWSAAGPTPYRLGSQNPQDNTIWGRNRVDVPATIRMGSPVTLSFNLTAPSQPGTYNLQWRMVQELVEWFGGHTPNVAITVVAKDKEEKDTKEEPDKFEYEMARELGQEEASGAKPSGGEEDNQARGQAFIRAVERPPVGDRVVSSDGNDGASNRNKDGGAC